VRERSFSEDLVFAATRDGLVGKIFSLLQESDIVRDASRFRAE